MMMIQWKTPHYTFILLFWRQFLVIRKYCPKCFVNTWFGFTLGFTGTTMVNSLRWVVVWVWLDGLKSVVVRPCKIQQQVWFIGLNASKETEHLYGRTHYLASLKPNHICYLESNDSNGRKISINWQDFVFSL